MKRPEDVRKELEDLSPRLLKLKEQDEGFQLPPHYFQTLQNEVLGKVQAVESADSKKSLKNSSSWLDQIKAQWQFLFQPRWALSFATLALLIVIGVGFYQQNQAPSAKMGAALAKIDQQTLNAYIQENIHEFDTETLMEFASNKANQVDFTELNSEELDQYLDEVIQDLDDEAIQKLL